MRDPTRARRWQLQRQAQRILNDKVAKLDRFENEIMAHKYRVARCHRSTDGGAPAIRRSPDHNHARFVGLYTCGSVHHCPICAPKVAGFRRNEMNQAIAAWLHQGHEVFFVTYTMQHAAEDYGSGQLQLQLDHLGAALSSFKGSRAFCRVMERAGFKGAIRALETTYGELNGWHSHTHDLIFAGAGALPELRALRSLWARKLLRCGLAGLKPGDIGVERFRKLRHLLQRCLTVQPGQYAAEYVAKFGREPESERGAWGIGSEMTRAHMKQGRAPDRAGTPQRCGHATPWGLLNDALDGDRRSADLFREYALAFQGKRQLYWSKGLREYFFGVVERSDDEIAAAPDARCTEHVCELSPFEWQKVLAHNARWELLQVAAINGRDGVRLMLDTLEFERPSENGIYTESRAIWMTRKKAA